MHHRPSNSLCLDSLHCLKGTSSSLQRRARKVHSFHVRRSLRNVYFGQGRVCGRVCMHVPIFATLSHTERSGSQEFGEDRVSIKSTWSRLPSVHLLLAKLRSCAPFCRSHFEMRNEQNWNVLGGERQGWRKDLMKCLWKCTTVKRNVGAEPGAGVGKLHLAVVFKPSEDTYVGWGMESFYKTLE